MIITCNGCFDGLHPGHLFYLGYCLAQGSELIVFINNDDYIRRVKKRKPIPQEQRQADLEKLGFIRSVQIFENDPIEFLNWVLPDVHCVSEEYKESGCKEAQFCKENNIKIAWVPRVGDWSSTKLRST